MDIKKMSRAVFVGPVPFEMDGEHTLGTHFAQWDARDGVSEHAVNKEASANFYRQKHSGIGTTCPNRIDERPGVEHDAIAGREIRRRNGQGNVELFECPYLQDAAQKTDHALIAGEAVA